MVVAFALAAALANAFVVVAQHVASTRAPGGVSGVRLAAHLARDPLWLAGWVALLAAFVFQALALHGGQLSVVQPLLVTELVFALLLRRWWLRQRIRGAAWGSALLVTAGLGVFLVAAEPRGGVAVATSGAWLGAVLAAAGGAAVLVALGRSGSPRRSAALFGAGAAAVWALEATFIKATTDTLASFGVGGTLVRWPVYALAVGGAVGFLVEQAALHAGPLTSSQPMMVIVDPLVSIALSVWLFDEHFTGDPVVLALGAVGFVAMCTGVVLLVRTVPASLTGGPEAAGGVTPASAG